jgi:hypothetical protein
MDVKQEAHLEAAFQVPRWTTPSEARDRLDQEIDDFVRKAAAAIAAPDRADMVFDPIPYLPLIEKKINALDQAAPLAEWDLPHAFATLRRLMETRMSKAGRREYVQARTPAGDLRHR